MDWHQKYIEKHKKHKGKSFNFVINARILRFKVNPPLTAEHLSELEYLLKQYDIRKALLKRYENILSEETKNEWLKNHLRNDAQFSHQNYNIYNVLLPFYLINPETKNPKIDKHFLDDQLILILGAIDHNFKRYRKRAKILFEFLIPNFFRLKPYLKTRIIELLSAKSNSENIQIINFLFFRNLEVIAPKSVNKHINKQLNRGLIKPKMAIGILRRVKHLTQVNKERLKKEVRKMEKGEYVLKSIKPN